MKHAIRLALFLTLAPLALRAQEAPDDRYIAIYDLIQTADTALEQNSTVDARAKYVEAQTLLKKFAVDFPNWNSKIVNFRLNYLDTKLGSTTARIESPKAANKASNELQAVDSDRELSELQSQLRAAQIEKAALEKKLAATPTAKALADAQAQVRQLADENKTLKATVKTVPGSHSVDATTLDRITSDLAGARAKLEEQTKSISALSSEKDLLQKRIDAVSAAEGKSPAAAQLTTLQTQLAKLAGEKNALADQLKAAQSANVDTAKLARTEVAIKELQRENNLLRATVEKGQSGALQFTNTTAISELQQSLADLTAKLNDQSALVAKLNSEKSELQKQIDLLAAAGSTNRELLTTQKSLVALKRKFDIQTEAAVILISEANLKIAKLNKSNAALTTQNGTLKKQLSSLASTTKFVVEGLKEENETLRTAAKTAKPAAVAALDNSADFAKIEEQLAMLRAKVTVLEAQPVAYSAEELALFRKPESASLAKISSDKTDKSAKKLPASANDLIAEAQRAFGKQDYELARAKYLDVLKLDDKNVYTLGNLATIELEMDKLDDAEKHLQTALAIKPKDAFSLGALGNLRIRQGKYDAALDALSSAAQINPNDAEIQNFLGVTLSQKGQRAAAEAALRKAIQLDPQYGSAHNNLAVIYLTQTPPQIELARWHYQKALAAGQPRNPELEKMMDDAGKTPEAKP